jgi:hypothetical protein
MADDGTDAGSFSNAIDSADRRADAGPGCVKTTMRSTAPVTLEPDAILPAQLMGGRRFDAASMPEKRLLLAVLEDAVITFQRYTTSTQRRGQRLFREAEAWIVSDDVRSACSFQNVCDVLGFDSAYLRQGLLAWRERRRDANALPEPYRHTFRRLSGSRTRAIGCAIGLESVSLRARRRALRG